jgi:hypothetical protein
MCGGVSAVASQSLGQDVFVSRDQGRVTLENAYAGLKLGDAEKGLLFDVSGGAQPYRVGSGMLIAVGGVE